MRDLSPVSTRPQTGAVRPSLVFFIAACVAMVLFLLSAPANAATFVARDGANSVRLFTTVPCTNPAVLAHVPSGLASQFHAAVAEYEGKHFEARWRPAGAAVFLVFDDGDQGMVTMNLLHQELDV